MWSWIIDLVRSRKERRINDLRKEASFSNDAASFRTTSKKNHEQVAFIMWREESFPMQVAGESYYQENLKLIAGQYKRQSQEINCEADLLLEPNNQFDSNAIVVKISILKVGYVNQHDAGRLNKQMRENGIIRCRCKARIRGGWRTNQFDEGMYGVKLSIPTRGKVNFRI